MMIPGGSVWTNPSEADTFPVTPTSDARYAGTLTLPPATCVVTVKMRYASGAVPAKLVVPIVHVAAAAVSGLKKPCAGDPLCAPLSTLRVSVATPAGQTAE